MDALLFALPIADVDANTPVADSKWQYALDNDAQRKGRDIKVERQPMPATWNWSMDAPIKLKVSRQGIRLAPDRCAGFAKFDS